MAGEPVFGRESVLTRLHGLTVEIDAEEFMDRLHTAGVS
jgi:hypothetical protein